MPASGVFPRGVSDALEILCPACLSGPAPDSAPPILSRRSAGASPLLCSPDVSTGGHPALGASSFLGLRLDRGGDTQASRTAVDMGALGDSWNGEFWSGELGRTWLKGQEGSPGGRDRKEIAKY